MKAFRGWLAVLTVMALVGCENTIMLQKLTSEVAAAQQSDHSNGFGTLYTASFDRNSPTATGTMADQKIPYGSPTSLSLNQYVNPGYGFGGWAATPTGAKVYGDGEAFSIGKADVILYATWIAGARTITFDKNDPTATGSMAPQGVAGNTTVNLNLNQFTKVGFSFAGWALTPTGAKTYDDHAAASVGTTDLTLFALWARNTYSLTFLKDDPAATGTMAPISLAYNTPSTLPLNTYLKSGYSFAGWADTSGGAAAHADGASYSVGPGNANLYAVWTRNSYKVSFNPGTGSGSMADQTLPYGVPTNLNASTFTKQGYSFGGWATRSGGTAAFTDGASYTIGAGPVTLWAVWVAGAVHVNFDKNNASATGAMSPQAITANSSAFLVTNSFSLTGYSFAGWATTPGGAVVYANQAAYSIGTLDVTLYAVWTKNSYTVTFKKDDGLATGTMADQVMVYNTTQALTANAFLKTGYTFAGWATTSGGALAYTNGASYTMGPANTTLFALWTVNTYAVSFNSNDPGGTGPGVTGSMATQSLPYGIATNLNANGYSKAGFSFAGWATTPGGTVVYNDLGAYTMGVGPVTLYAKWTANTYTLTFDGNQATSGSMSPQPIVYQAPANLSDNQFVRTGYTFAGWGTAANGSATYSNKQSYSIGPGSVTLYAIWSPNAQTITFHSNWGTDVTSVQNSYSGATVNLAANAFVAQTHYYFLGWSTSSGSSIVSYPDQASITMPPNNLVLYGVWQLRATCTVTLYPYYTNGSMTPNDSPWVIGPLYVGETFVEPTSPPFPAQSGFYLVGWINGQVYRGTPMPWDSGHRPGTIVLTGNTYLYAKWDNSQFSCYLDPNGGGGTLSQVNGGVHLYDSWTVPDNILGFTPPSGQGFAGWAASPGATAPDYYPGQIITNIMSNRTLYAVWGNLHSITYVAPLSPYVNWSFPARGTMNTSSNIPAGSRFTVPPCGYSLVADYSVRSGSSSNGTFKQWSGTGGPYADQATIVMPDTDLTLFAQF